MRSRGKRASGRRKGQSKGLAQILDKNGNEASRGALPNLLVVGAAKCGTTSLHNYLDGHPDIAMSEVKEPNFFVIDGTWTKGIDWYRSHFDPDAAVRGESSTSYSMLPRSQGAVERISSVLGDPRIVYLVREPIARIASQYHQLRAGGRESRPIAEALHEPGNLYVTTSLYATQIRPYVERFGAERILVESQERLLVNRADTLRHIFQFLGVDESVQIPDAERVWETSDGKGWGYTLAWKAAERIHARGIRLPRALRWPVQRAIRSRLLGGGSPDARPPEVEDATRRLLEPRLREELHELEELTGTSLDALMIPE